MKSHKQWAHLSSNNFIVRIQTRLSHILSMLPLAFKGLILGPVVLIVGINVYQWIKKEYPQRPPDNPNTEKIQHPNYHHIATKALRNFSELPSGEQFLIYKNLRSNVVPVKHWTNKLLQSDYKILCLGESHRETTRSFLAKKLFTQLNFDALQLEATPQKLAQINHRLQANKEYSPLLDADIQQILQTLIKKNADIQIYGIEETAKQSSARRKTNRSRDQSIAINFWDKFNPEIRNIVLLGAKHCSNPHPWFYSLIKKQARAHLQNKIINAQVLGEHEDGPLEAFVYFLDRLKLVKEDIAISDTATFSDEILNWFPLLNHSTFKNFQTIIIYRQ